MRMADPLRAYPGPHDDPTDGEGLERRVRRLEDAVAAIQDTQIMEDRVVERVVERVEQAPYSPREGSGVIASAARMLMPKTVDAVPTENAGPVEAARTAWLFSGLVNDLRWMLRMFTDYRYRMSWTGRIVLVAAIVAGILSWFVISGLPFVGGILDRVVLVLAGVVTYKAMAREVQRYQELMARVWRYR
jgi:hypothetical protein